MPDIVGIRFKSCGKIYDFDANALPLRPGDKVVIESDFGLSIGTVAEPPHHEESAPKELKKVLRIADAEDFRQKTDNEKFEQEAKSFCYERIMARGLPMKLVCAEATLDKKRIVFYFTADGRIDFRELVKDLAARFKTRIEMRQIGVRDKAKLVGGFGLCGKELCCRMFLTTFEPISIKMAKQQDLTLNTGKLSGSCGRLMCCLGYEYHEGGAVAAARGREDIPAEKETVEAAVQEETVSPEPAAEEQAGKTAEGRATAGQDEAQKQGQRKRRRRRRSKKKVQKNE
jgi:cell fate regulator YaaT (PSP1 superfamily)